MSRFTPTVTFTTTFDGDDISISLRRMSNEQMLILSPYIVPSDKDESGIVRITKLVAAAKPVLLACVIGMSGLKDDTGASMTMANIVDEMYFAKLLDTILGELIEVSILTVNDAKKLPAVQPVEPSAEKLAGS